MLMDQSAFTGKGSLSRYTLDINHSAVRPDVLRFRGTEALSQPF
ncbi:VgrG protein [Kosakonia radicincitans]|nr:VgrG protein [Kosakonia radicincitans]